MASGWIKTEEQRDRHKEACKSRYRAAKAADPDLNKKAWSKKKERLIADGKYADYVKCHDPLVKRAYMRHRDRYLRPDQVKREGLVIALGGKCVHCGYDADIRALELDHKNGDGHLDRKRLGSKVHRYYCTRIDEARDNLQVLCANCNKIKAIENKEHNRSRRVSDWSQPKIIGEFYFPCHA